MIRVTVHLVRPLRRDVELARIEIHNQSGGGPAADYSCKFLLHQPNGDLSVQQRPIFDFARLRWNVWGLVHAALVALGPDAMSTGAPAPTTNELPEG